VTAAAALLRGINVGGRSKVAMADLRRIAADLGLADVTTYVQSGNLVFTTRHGDVDEAISGLEAAIASEIGLEITVIARTAQRLAEVAAGHPFASAQIEHRMLHVVFLADRPTSDAVAALDSDRSPPDRFEVRGDHIYLSYPGGSGRSKLSLDWFERELGVRGTARNWNTVTKLAEMTAQLAA
jgi:uncharacterized protein (DUF1697 family)